MHRSRSARLNPGAHDLRPIVARSKLLAGVTPCPEPMRRYDRREMMNFAVFLHG